MIYYKTKFNPKTNVFKVIDIVGEKPLKDDDYIYLTQDEIIKIKSKLVNKDAVSPDISEF